MNLLQIVQEVCRRTGIGVPASVATSGDDQTLQLMGLLNEILDDLDERKAFTFLQATALFYSTGVSDQGEITSLANGYVKLRSNLFNRTTGEVILGPISADIWQANEAGILTVSPTEYRIIGNHLYLKPALAAENQIAFEYQTSIAVKDTTTGYYKQYFTLDTDTCLFPDKVLMAGLRWIWKREKGLRYAENLRSYEAIVANMAGSDGGNSPKFLDGDPEFTPGINIPEGSWSVS